MFDFKSLWEYAMTGCGLGLLVYPFPCVFACLALKAACLNVTIKDLCGGAVFQMEWIELCE